jgi:hypothetical protein
MQSAWIKRMGEGHAGITGNRDGKACRIASALSKAMRPKTTNTLVIKKKNASSISRPFQTCNPDFVPDSMTQVPRLNAMVSTIHKYKVCITIGTKELVRGSPKTN